MTAPSVVIVSGDSHIGPRPEDMREYCPPQYLDEWDAAIKNQQFIRSELAAGKPGMGGAGFGKIDGPPDARALYEQCIRIRKTDGHHDMHARIRDMDRDGIAAEVIFHGSQNGESIPFVGPSAFSFGHSEIDVERTYAGLHAYNQWLADVCSIEPGRHVGCVKIPQWDIDACVREVEWARDAGLGAVNFSAPRAGILPYDDPTWEPFWSACEALELPLATHGGAVDFMEVMTATPGPQLGNIIEIEIAGWLSRRGLHRLIFGGVFARHPELRFVPTEQNGDWWTAAIAEFDSSYHTHRWELAEQLPRWPHEYMADNVFIGASFMAPFEAELAVERGYVDNIIWGSDYPHAEGTWQYQEDGDDENMTRLSLRYCFSDIPDDAMRQMVGGNAMRVYGFDAAELQAVADRIGAPTAEELAEPIDALPPTGRGGVFAFRTIGPWG